MKIDEQHRYLIKQNTTRSFVGSTNDLDITLPIGHQLVDTIGEDDLGPGIRTYLAERAGK